MYQQLLKWKTKRKPLLITTTLSELALRSLTALRDYYTRKSLHSPTSIATMLAHAAGDRGLVYQVADPLHHQLKLQVSWRKQPVRDETEDGGSKHESTRTDSSKTKAGEYELNNVDTPSLARIALVSKAVISHMVTAVSKTSVRKQTPKTNK